MLLSAAPGEAWVLFLEKAFAQLFKNYSKLEYNYPEIALQCLTGNRGGQGGFISHERWELQPCLRIVAKCMD